MTKGNAMPNLRRLRLAKGITQNELAQTAGITRFAYQKIESGESVPKVSTLQSIAQALGVKLQDLLIPVEVPHAVRFRAAKRLNSRDAILFDVVKWLKDFSDLERRLGSEVVYRLGEMAQNLIGMPPGRERTVQTAAQAREALALKPKESIRDICGLLESAGVKVYSKAVASDGFFGLAVGPGDGGPAIVVNVWDRISVERWIFTAAHELGHLLLHLDSFDVSQTEEDKGQEEEANVFASYFLMPEVVFKREWEETRGLPFLDRVMKLKRIFRVSYRTVLYRLAETSELGENVWGRFQAEYKRRTGKTLGIKEEPSALFRAEEPEYLAQPDFVPNRLPRLVREAVEKHKISLGRGAEILELDLVEMRQRAASWVDA